MYTKCLFVFFALDAAVSTVAQSCEEQCTSPPGPCIEGPVEEPIEATVMRNFD
jgi:hypothetical protein